jgi:hypothetical protein
VGPTSAYSEDAGKQHRVSAPRQRRCLLKGCEAWFRARHPLTRYCSTSCGQAARRWTQWRANRRYRQTAQGKACRREQCRRRRERCRRRENGLAAGTAGREGYQEAGAEKKISCTRPGCYECFAPDLRSPLKKFCNHACWRALRRVLLREARWRRRFARLAYSLPPPFPGGC